MKGYKNNDKASAKIDTIKNQEQENTINKILLPELFKHIKALLTPKEGE